MFGFVLIGALAAFGLVCAVWVLWGLFDRSGHSGKLVYRGKDPLRFARRYLWLREMGLMKYPLTMAVSDPNLKQWLEDQGIGTIAEAEAGLEIGEKQIDGRA